MKSSTKRISIIIILLFAAAGLFIVNYYDYDAEKENIVKEKPAEKGKFEKEGRSVRKEREPEIARQAKTSINLKAAKKLRPAEENNVQHLNATEEKKPVSKKALEEVYRDKKFESNEEIKKEFGRLEIVYLFNGQSFIGYVLSIDEFYSMVTIDGFKKIPMKDVKMREIIN
jgi:hypothetical protein